jgi:carbonic anhydrase
MEDLLAGNARYAEQFDQAGPADLDAVPRRHLAIVTCMDTRLDAYAMLGLTLGDAHVIRNAGGRVTDDVLRSLIVSIEVLGTTAVAVIQHTDCGMAKTTDDQLRALVRERRGADPEPVRFLAIDDHADAIRGDVANLRASPFLPADLEVRGFLYDVRTGRLAAV